MGLLKLAAQNLARRSGPKVATDGATGSTDIEQTFSPWVKMCPKTDLSQNPLDSVDRVALQKMIMHLLANPQDTEGTQNMGCEGVTRLVLSCVPHGTQWRACCQVCLEGARVLPHAFFVFAPAAHAIMCKQVLSQ